MIKTIKNEIISFPAYRYRKLTDLLQFCKEPKEIDVVLKSIEALCEVFCDILPSYRIRQYDDAGEESKSTVKVSKEVEALRTQEQYILNSYKDYLQILEVFSKLKVGKLAKGSSDKDKSSTYYERLRSKSVICFSALLDRHPHFNYRLNIL